MKRLCWRVAKACLQRLHISQSAPRSRSLWPPERALRSAMRVLADRKLGLTNFLPDAVNRRSSLPKLQTEMASKASSSRPALPSLDVPQTRTLRRNIHGCLRYSMSANSSIILLPLHLLKLRRSNHFVCCLGSQVHRQAEVSGDPAHA